MEAQEIEVMTRTAAAGVQVLMRLESTRAVCDCMAAIMSGDLIPKPSQAAPAGDTPQPLTPSERLLPLSHPRASPGGHSPEWVADLLVAVLQRAGQSSAEADLRLFAVQGTEAYVAHFTCDEARHTRLKLLRGVPTVGSQCGGLHAPASKLSRLETIQQVSFKGLGFKQHCHRSLVDLSLEGNLKCHPASICWSEYHHESSFSDQHGSILGA